MNIKVRTNISSEFEDIEIVINSPEKNDLVQRIENSLIFETSKNIQKIIGMKGNDIFIIDVSDILIIYSEEKNNYCKTLEGIYRIKEKLYYLEDMLPKKEFIRISNSAIININKVKCFNTGIIGKMIVKFDDGSEETVSRRRISDIMKFLNERCEWYEKF